MSATPRLRKPQCIRTVQRPPLNGGLFEVHQLMTYAVAIKEERREWAYASFGFLSRARAGRYVSDEE